MKILLRHLGDEEYVWKDANYENGAFQVVTSENEIIAIKETNIVSVDEDERNKYVVCANCGEMIRNTPKSIEAHFSKMEKIRDCLKCNELSIGRRSKDISKSFVKLEGNKYQVVDKFEAALYCGSYTWTRKPIGSEQANAECKYLRCRKAGVNAISDVFTQYPGLFDTIITTTMLNDKKWNYDGVDRFNVNGMSGQQLFTYNGHLRDTLYALVNETGLVECFLVYHNRHPYIFYYSAKYDKLFYKWCEYYKEDIPDGISESKYESICKKIRQLYKEANVNE